MAQSNEIKVLLSVDGDELNPGEVARRSGLTPERMWRKGDARSTFSTLKQTTHGMDVYSGLPESSRFEEHLVALLARLEPAASYLRELIATKSILVWVDIYEIETGIPRFSLSREQVAAVASLGADLDFDIYYWAEDAEERNLAVGIDRRNLKHAYLTVAMPDVELIAFLGRTGLGAETARYVPGGDREIAGCVWIDSGCGDGEDLDEQLQALLLKVAPATQALAEFGGKKEVRFQAEVYEYIPAAYVGRPGMQGIAGLGAGLTIEISYFGESARVDRDAPSEGPATATDPPK
ncbi:MAG: DUF4279 domain-containing protein [Acidobacteriota bacterium]|nr:DUF4279 domain-containing protein [Acidobacteriota bacterium]